MLFEEFKRCIHSDVKSFLDEREVETLDVAARLADDYALTHKVSFVNKPYKKPFNPQFKPNTPQSKPFNPQQRNKLFIYLFTYLFVCFYVFAAFICLIKYC